MIRFVTLVLLIVFDVHYAIDTNYWRTCHQLFVANQRVADKCIKTGE